MIAYLLGLDTTLPWSICTLDDTTGIQKKHTSCAILIASINGGAVAIKEVLNAKNSIDQCTIPE